MADQCILFYERKLDSLCNDIMNCPQSKDTRHSTTYFEQKNSVMGKISSENGGSEPQLEHRLHSH